MTSYYYLKSILASFLILIFLINRLQKFWRLKHIPGPIAASLTNLWGFTSQYNRPLLPTLLDAHRKYGNVVRIGPNRVSVSRAQFVKIIYPSNGTFKKADSYSPMRVLVNGRSVGSVIDMQDEQQTRALKRVVGTAFTTSSLQDYEADVDSTLMMLIQRITKYPRFNLYHTMQFYQLVFLIKFAFSESPGHLSTGQDVLRIAKSGGARISHWISWQALPSTERFFFQNSFWGRWLKTSSEWAQMGVSRLHARLALGYDSSKPQDLLQKCIDASRQHPDVLRQATVSSLVNSIIAAGADTTAATLATTIYFLMKNSRVTARLREELNEVMGREDLIVPPSLTLVKGLPYLDAVIKEALRLNPILALPLERVVPEAGCTVDGYFIPGGTIIGCMPSVVHLDQSCYGKDAAGFRPERWLEASKDDASAMERGLLSWGGGSRQCLGRHLAEMELKKVLAALLTRFDMVLDDKDFEMPFQHGILEFEKYSIQVTFRERQVSEFK